MAVLRATTPLPQPLTVAAPVTNDVMSRTLIVRRPRDAGGYQKLLWREAHEALRQSEEAGWPLSGAPWLSAAGAGQRDIARGLTGPNLALHFHFPVGVAAYYDLVSRPVLRAYVTVDKNTGFFTGVTFRTGERGARSTAR
jgi:hypothetical protein